MAGLADVLANYQVIGIDTSPFIYYVEDHPEFAIVARAVFDRLTGGVGRGVTSVVTIMEVSVKPLREQRLAVANAYSSLVQNIPNLDIVSIEQPDAWRAAGLRAAHTLHPADALQIAACIGAGAEVFVTNDRRLRQINAIDVLILSDYV